MSSSCHGKLEKPGLHSGSSYFVFAVIMKNTACFCTHLVYRPSTFMSRTKVIITKFLLSKFSYVLYDLGFFYDTMADEESSSSSRSTSEKRKEPSRSEEDSPQEQRKDDSRPREDSCSSPVTLGLFHDFLGKLDERFNEIEQCLKRSARGLKRGRNLSDGLGLSGDNDPDKSESKSQDGAKAHLPSFHALSEEPLASKRVRYDDAFSISTVSTFSLPSQSIYPRVVDEEEYQQFGSESDDDFSMGNSHRNDPDEFCHHQLWVLVG